ncbi:MAG: hypothetical protein ABIR15_07645 [Chitinophagaceae bacterium]
MNSPLRKWLQISFFNLLLVAFLGIILRYKIAFSLPFVDQKYLLHGHSHFAFAGWVTQALMTLLVAYLRDQGMKNIFKKYNFLLYANLLTAYGMLVTFTIQGYGPFSIGFSTLSIIVSCVFAVQYWKDLNKQGTTSVSHSWFKAAVVFNAASSIGVFGLAFMMVAKNNHPAIYLASIYFYLHFQYNGWFFFACMGLLCTQLIKYGVNATKLKMVYRLFMLACVPAYLLSTIWLPLPTWVYILIVIAVFMQLGGWLILLQSIKPIHGIIKKTIPLIALRIILLSAIALSVKLCLQMGSVIPSLSKLTFGFRPIVIGYLHLVLLGIITLFIIGYILAVNYISISKVTAAGLIIFVLGIIFNETLLMTQGIADINYQAVPFINPLLLLAALVLFAGVFIINYGIRKTDSPADKIHIELTNNI